MFKNAERDPLAVPTAPTRTSVGPTRRVHAVRTVTANDFAGNGSASSWDDGPTCPECGVSARFHQPHEPERHRHEDMGFSPEDVQRLKSRPQAARALEFEARDFLAQDHNCDDRSELLFRAERHARTLTSTWSQEASERVAQAFTARVAELIPNRPRVAAAQSPTVFEDFDDQLLY
jgi:hypothetical protein